MSFTEFFAPLSWKPAGWHLKAGFALAALLLWPSEAEACGACATALLEAAYPPLLVWAGAGFVWYFLYFIVSVASKSRPEYMSSTL